MSKFRYKIGECAILTKPIDTSLKGFEIEIVGIHSIVDKTYDIRILATDELAVAKENQLSSLDPANTPLRWEDCPWWLQQFRKQEEDDAD